MPYGYIDPVQRVHDQQAAWNLAHPNWGQPQQQYPVQPYPVQPDPLHLSNVPQILYGNGPQPRSHVPAVTGAVIGGLIGAWIARRRQRKQQEGK